MFVGFPDGAVERGFLESRQKAGISIFDVWLTWNEGVCQIWQLDGYALRHQILLLLMKANYAICVFMFKITLF